eukprot:7363464-Pyramimonas_sp.AAC.1
MERHVGDSPAECDAPHHWPRELRMTQTSCKLDGAYRASLVKFGGLGPGPPKARALAASTLSSDGIELAELVTRPELSLPPVAGLPGPLPRGEGQRREDRGFGGDGRQS